MSNQGRSVLYISVTSDLVKRVAQHRSGSGAQFTSRYNCNALVFFEEYNDVNLAIAREKQLKNWKREWKDTLIKNTDPTLADLAAEW